MKTLTKIISMVALVGIMVGGLIGCTPTMKVEDVKIITDNYEKQIADNKVQLEQLQTQATLNTELQTQMTNLQNSLKEIEEQKARDELVLADYKAELEKVQQEQIVIETPEGESYIIDDITLGSGIANTTITNTKLASLKDGIFEFDGDNYDFEQKIVLTEEVKVLTSLNGDEEFEAKPVLVFDAVESLQYVFEFDDDFNYSLVSEDESLSIDFGGKTYNIIEFKATEFTYVDGQKVSLLENGESTVYEKIIKVVSIGKDKVVLKVGEEQVIADEKETKTVDGISVRVDEVFYTGKESQQSMVELTVNNLKAEVTVEDGDEFIANNDKFEWKISTTGTNLDSISVVLVEKINDLDEGVIQLGESFDFAGLFSIGFELEKVYDMKEFSLEFDEIQVNNTDINVVKFDTDSNDLVIGEDEVETAYFNGTNVFYKDNSNDWVITTGLKLVNDDFEYSVGMSGTNLTVGNIVFDLQSGFTKFGLLERDAEGSDISVNGVSLGTREFDVLLEDGVVILKPEAGLDNDEVVIALPEESVEAQIKIK